MTEQELRQLLADKGYQYEEAKGPHSGYLCVYAVKSGVKKLVGVKDLLLASSVDFFKQNRAYTKL